jgi:CheY-like chemotaxis protein
MEAPTPPALHPGLVVADDLMFASQIQGLARSAGYQLTWVRSADQAVVQARALEPTCVVIDINMIGAGIKELVASLKAKEGSLPVLIGFGSHVDAASLHRAREAGCDQVLPRSKLVQELAEKLKSLSSRK